MPRKDKLNDVENFIPKHIFAQQKPLHEELYFLAKINCNTLLQKNVCLKLEDKILELWMDTKDMGEVFNFMYEMEEKLKNGQRVAPRSIVNPKASKSEYEKLRLFIKSYQEAFNITLTREEAKPLYEAHIEAKKKDKDSKRLQREQALLRVAQKQQKEKEGKAFLETYQPQNNKAVCVIMNIYTKELIEYEHQSYACRYLDVESATLYRANGSGYVMKKEWITKFYKENRCNQ
jgi:CRISPR/Cas system type I-B associated protein Csh2 (Cas7 group RAMP superfamily)